jgi:hypothetical protein
MVSPEALARVARSATNDSLFLAAIQGAYTEAGKNELESFILNNLLPNEQIGELDECDIVSDFFTVFG